MAIGIIGFVVGASAAPALQKVGEEGLETNASILRQPEA